MQRQDVSSISHLVVPLFLGGLAIWPKPHIQSKRDPKLSPVKSQSGTDIPVP